MLRCVHFSLKLCLNFPRAQSFDDVRLEVFNPFNMLYLQLQHTAVTSAVAEGDMQRAALPFKHARTPL